MQARAICSFDVTPLSPGLVALLLLAALMHASWNALVKSDPDRLISFGVLMAVGGLVALVALPFVPPLAREAWPYLVASILIHNVYYFLLLRAYRFGDLSHVYPIARGIGPLLVAVVSAQVLGEHLGLVDASGVVLVSSGILSLALANGIPRGDELRPTAYALATGVTIALYTVVDGLGARQTPNPLSYIAWLSLLEAPWLLGLAAWRRGGAVWPQLRSYAWRGAVGGVIAVVGYGIAIWALSRGTMANVAALRETSVLFAAFFGTVWLGEAFGRWRIFAATLVVAGLVVMNLSSRS